ncbi:hypothetical protein [Glacieibacterium sp.]|uniref:hypothetical protein n=1 Tax=Glacieibacterium sp. TaxID=2860237 RepID=UPI003B000286
MQFKHKAVMILAVVIALLVVAVVAVSLDNWRQRSNPVLPQEAPLPPRAVTSSPAAS